MQPATSSKQLGPPPAAPRAAARARPLSLLSVLRLDIFCLLCHLSAHLVPLSVTIRSLCMESRRRTWEPECRRGTGKKHDKNKTQDNRGHNLSPVRTGSAFFPTRGRGPSP
eukprot:scaffold12869_cov93-Isochrysis_galbana.AAC.2